MSITETVARANAWEKHIASLDPIQWAAMTRGERAHERLGFEAGWAARANHKEQS